MEKKKHFTTMTELRESYETNEREGQNFEDFWTEYLADMFALGIEVIIVKETE